MKRLPHIFFLLAFCLCCHQLQAQNPESQDNETVLYNMASMFMYTKDLKQTTGFLDMEVDSIVFSRRMPNGETFEHPVMQYVFTRDSLYRTPLCEIDSIGFRTPETIYQDDVMIVDRSFSDYIIEIDSASYTLDLSAPKYMIPEVGQIVHSEIYKRITGKVLSVDRTAFGTKINLKYGIRYGRIYKQLYAINHETEFETPDGVKRRIKYTSAPSKEVSTEKPAWYPEVVREVKPWNWADLLTDGGTFLVLNPGISANIPIKQAALEITTGVHFIYNISMKSVPTVNEGLSLDMFKKHLTIRALDPYYMMEATAKGGAVNHSLELKPTQIGDEDNSLWIKFKPDFNIEASVGIASSFKILLPETEMKIGFGITSDQNSDELGTPEPLIDGEYFKFTKVKSGNIIFKLGVAAKAEAVFDFDVHIPVAMQPIIFKFHIGTSHNAEVNPLIIDKDIITDGSPTYWYHRVMDFDMFKLTSDTYVAAQLNLMGWEPFNERYDFFGPFEVRLFPNLGNVRVSNSSKRGLVDFEFDAWGQSATTPNLGVMVIDTEHWDILGPQTIFKCSPNNDEAGRWTNTYYPSFTDMRPTIDNPLHFKVKNAYVKPYRRQAVLPCMTERGSSIISFMYPLAGGEPVYFTVFPEFEFTAVNKNENQHAKLEWKLYGLTFTDIQGNCGFVAIDAADLGGRNFESMQSIIKDKELVKKIKYIQFPASELKDCVDRTDEIATYFDMRWDAIPANGHKWYFAFFNTLDAQFPYGDLSETWFTPMLSTYVDGKGMDLVETITPITSENEAKTKVRTGWNPRTDDDKMLIAYYKKETEKTWKDFAIFDLTNGGVTEVTFDGLASNTRYDYAFVLTDLDDEESFEKIEGVKFTTQKADEPMSHPTFKYAFPYTYTDDNGRTKLGAAFTPYYTHRTGDIGEVIMLFTENATDINDAKKKLTYQNIGHQRVYRSYASDATPDESNTCISPRELKPDKTYYVRFIMQIANKNRQDVQMSRAKKGNGFDGYFNDEEYGMIVYKYSDDIYVLSSDPGSYGEAADVTVKAKVYTDNAYSTGKVLKVMTNKFAEAEEAIVKANIAIPGAEEALIGILNNTQSYVLQQAMMSSNPSPERHAYLKARNRVPEADEQDDIEGEQVEYIIKLEDLGLDESRTYVWRPSIISDGDETIGPLFSITTDYFGGQDVEVVNEEFETIDLGLSVLWTNMNLGAKNEMQYGDYYSWGKLTVSDIYDDESYQPVISPSIHGDQSVDAARHELGEGYHIPTTEQWQELIDNCDWDYKTNHEVWGFEGTSKINGNKIFLPSAGVKYSNKAYDQTYCGCYWTANQSAKDEVNDVDPELDADRMHFDTSDYAGDPSKIRPRILPGRKYYGRSIRAVKDK